MSALLPLVVVGGSIALVLLMVVGGLDQRATSRGPGGIDGPRAPSGTSAAGTGTEPALTHGTDADPFLAGAFAATPRRPAAAGVRLVAMAASIAALVAIATAGGVRALVWAVGG